MDDFERLDRALADFREAIKPPFIWLIDHPIIIVLWLCLAIILVAIDLLSR